MLTRFIFLMLVACATHAADIAPFSSDGCSAFPDGTIHHQQLWHGCCVAHDLAYWQGGDYAQRLAADVELRQCVAALGQQSVAGIMLLGVRVGGSPWWPTKFRWGYGWPYLRGYKPLSEKERLAVQKKWPQSFLQPLSDQSNYLKTTE